MAARALAAAVAARRIAGYPALASTRGGGAQNHSSIRRSSAHPQAEERNADDHDATVTAAQVEAALNTKNVEEVAQDLGARASTVLPDEVVRDADAAWVPDQDTGVFVPAEEAAGNGTHDVHGASVLDQTVFNREEEMEDDDAHGASVLDQTVFNREEEMEDVERPAIDMANGDAGAK